MNNPLHYNDPSGEFWHLVIGAAIGGTFNMIANWNKAENGWQRLGYFGIGAAAGALGAGVGAGVSSAIGGGTFGAGFLGTKAAEVATTSFLSGAAIGGSGGFASGFTTGFGNGLMGGQNFGKAMWNGTKTGLIAGGGGFLVGGTLSGLNSNFDGRDFWDGSGLSYQERLNNAVTRESLHNRDSEWLVSNGKNAKYVRKEYNLNYPKMKLGKLYLSEAEYTEYGANWGTSRRNITLITKNTIKQLDGYGIDVLRHEYVHQTDMLNGFARTSGLRGYDLIQALEVRAYARNLIAPYANGTITKTVNILVTDWNVNADVLFDFLMNYYNGTIPY